ETRRACPPAGLRTHISLAATVLTWLVSRSLAGEGRRADPLDPHLAVGRPDRGRPPRRSLGLVPGPLPRRDPRLVPAPRAAGRWRGGPGPGRLAQAVPAAAALPPRPAAGAIPRLAEGRRQQRGHRLLAAAAAAARARRRRRHGLPGTPG